MRHSLQSLSVWYLWYKVDACHLKSWEKKFYRLISGNELELWATYLWCDDVRNAHSICINQQVSV